MSQDFINPNWHIIFIHYPLGLLAAGILIELFSFFWRRSGFRAAGRWMILLGALSSIPTALLGLFALVDVARINNDNAFGHWNELVASSPLKTNHGGRAWEMLITHMWYQVAATAVFVLVVVVWLGASDLWRKRLHIPLLILLLAGAGAMVVGAWYGGESVYRHGVGIQNQTAHLGDGPTARHQEGGVAWATTRQAASATTQPAAAGRSPQINVAAEQQTETEPTARDIEYYVMPLQFHVTLAGFAVAVALAALGLSIRRVSETRPADDASRFVKDGEHATEVQEPLGMTPEQYRDDEAKLRVDHSDEVGADTDIHIKRDARTPAGRFWLLAALVAASASLAGFWTLADEADAVSTARAEGVGFVGYLWKQVTSAELNDGSILNRRFLHVLGGSSIVLLPLVLAGLARWAPRAKLWLAIFAILLLGAVAVQVWLGILLMYDQPVGPVTGFVR